MFFRPNTYALVELGYGDLYVVRYVSLDSWEVHGAFNNSLEFRTNRVTDARLNNQMIDGQIYETEIASLEEAKSVLMVLKALKA